MKRGAVFIRKQRRDPGRAAPRIATNRAAIQGRARQLIAEFATDAASARQLIIEAAEIGARHCGALNVATLCSMLSGKYAPALEREGAKAAGADLFKTSEAAE